MYYGQSHTLLHAWTRSIAMHEYCNNNYYIKAQLLWPMIGSYIVTYNLVVYMIVVYTVTT